MGRIGAGMVSTRPGWILAVLGSCALVAALFWLMPPPRAIHAQPRSLVPLFRYAGGGANAQGEQGPAQANWSQNLLWLPFRAQARRLLKNTPGSEIAPPQNPPAESAMLLSMPANSAAYRSGIGADIGRRLKRQADFPVVVSKARPGKDGDAGSVRRGLQVEWGGGLAGRPLDVSPLLLADWPEVSKSIVMRASISIGADGRVSRVMLEMPSDDPALNAHAVRLMYRCALPPEVSAECEGTITLQPPLVPASPGH